MCRCFGYEGCVFVEMVVGEGDVVEFYGWDVLGVCDVGDC